MATSEMCCRKVTKNSYSPGAATLSDSVMVYTGSKLCTGGVVCRLRLLASSLADKHRSQSLHYSAKNKFSPRGRRDDMPPPMAVRLAADLRPSADGSAVRTMVKLQTTNVPTT